MNTSIPNWLACVQLIAFVVVYAVWILPETTALRNNALIIGSCSSLYPIYLLRASILSKNSLPIWFIVSLFAWVIFHYFFIGENHAKQLKELNSIWKYALILSIFGVGLGITIAIIDEIKIKIIFFIGISLPIIIFFIKKICGIIFEYYNIELLEYLIIPKTSSKYYIQKMDYVINCMPAMIFSLLGIYLNISKQNNKEKFIFLLFYILIFTSGLYLFFEINTKNGMMYITLFLLIFTIACIKYTNRNIFYIIILIALSSIFLLNHYNKNKTWNNIIVDYKASKNTSEILEWKNPNSENIILNSNYENVSKTTYFRVSWAIEGMKLILDHPLGYGLVENSFRYLALKKWYDASPNLSHTHSGWLDFTLAFGVIGIIIIFTAICFIIIKSFVLIFREKKSILQFYLLCGSIAIITLGFTNEISAKSTIPIIIFWIMVAGGSIIGIVKK